MTQLIDDSQFEVALIQALEEIGPEKLKSTSHKKYFSHLLTVSIEALKHDGSRLLLILDAIKSSEACYKRDLLIELLISIVSNEDVFNHLLCNPFGPTNSRSSLWKIFANSLASIPEIIANCQKCVDHKSLSTSAYSNQVSKHILKVLNDMPNRAQLNQEYLMFILQILGRLTTTSNKKIIFECFTSKFSQSLSNESRNFFQRVFRLALDTNNPLGSAGSILDQLYLPIFYYSKPCEAIERDEWSLIGAEAIDNQDFHYIVCDKALFSANYNLDKSRQKVILFNIFNYLCYVDSHQESKQNHLLNTLEKLLMNWSDGTKILLRLYEHNRYITWALLVGFRYALRTRRSQLAKEARNYQAAIAKAIPFYLNRSNHVEREIGSCVAEIVLPELHKVISELEKPSSGSSKQTVDFPDMKVSKTTTDFYKETVELFHGQVDDIFSTLSESQLADNGMEIERMKQSEREEKKSKPQHSRSTSKMVSEEVLERDNVESDEDDEIFEEELTSVPIYLRDCVNGLMEHNTGARYIRLCLTRACELVRKFCKEQQELDTIRDVGVELARTVLYMDDEHGIKNFQHLRMAILESLCNALPELIAKYLLEEFNGRSRSMRLQLDILKILVSSAEFISESPNNQPKGGGKINNFAKLVPFYFYGIIHRLKIDSGDYCLLTPQPLSVLEAFREGYVDETEPKDPSLDIVLSRALKMDGERQSAGISTNGPPLNQSKTIDRRVFELESASDDSYLLSRILVSISVILKCASQQPMLCRISSDLLDVLGAYRCHPDTGVQKSLLSCLSAIQAHTPSSYFSSYLERPMTEKFAPWFENKSLTQ